MHQSWPMCYFVNASLKRTEQRKTSVQLLQSPCSLFRWPYDFHDAVLNCEKVVRLLRKYPNINMEANECSKSSLFKRELQDVSLPWTSRSPNTNGCFMKEECHEVLVSALNSANISHSPTITFEVSTIHQIGHRRVTHRRHPCGIQTAVRAIRSLHARIKSLDSVQVRSIVIPDLADSRSEPHDSGVWDRTSTELLAKHLHRPLHSAGELHRSYHAEIVAEPAGVLGSSHPIDRHCSVVGPSRRGWGRSVERCHCRQSEIAFICTSHYVVVLDSKTTST